MFWISEALAARGLLGSSIIMDFLLSPQNPAAWGPKFVDFCFGNKVPEVKRTNRSLSKSKSKGCYLCNIGCCAAIVHVHLLTIDVSALIFSISFPSTLKITYGRVYPKRLMVKEQIIVKNWTAGDVAMRAGSKSQRPCLASTLINSKRA